MHGRISLILASAALAALAPAAHAAPTATLTSAVTLLQQPKGQAWQIGLATGAAFADADGSQPPAVQHMRISFPPGKANWDKFPVCQQARLEERKAPDGCPAGSRIGSGQSTVWARPIVADPIAATIDVFNGPPAGSARTLLFLARSSEPISTQIVMRGTLRRTTGRYGFQLDVTVPPIQTIPGSPNASVVSFTTLVQARRRGVSYLDAPRTCPHAGLPLAGKFDFADGSSECAGLVRAARRRSWSRGTRSGRPGRARARSPRP
jgi:hypothetical protein